MLRSKLLTLILLLGATLPAAAQVRIVTPTLPNGSVSTPYSATIDTRGGTIPFTWSAGGTLPPGLTLSSAARLATLSGSPSAAGTYSFGITVVGAGGHVSTATYTVTISPASGPQHSVTLTWQGTTGSYSVYRDLAPTGAKTLIASALTATTYTDAAVAAGTTYYYAVTQTNPAGVQSGFSNVVSAVIPSP